MLEVAWQTILNPLYGWVNTIQRIVCASRPPAIDGPVVNIVSDYSGEHRGSEYEVVSVLYLDQNASLDWQRRRSKIRQRFLADGRRLSFKRLGDRRRQQALIPFLEAADDILGICVSIAFRKSIRNLCTDQRLFQLFQSRLDFRSQWDQPAFERMLRVAHLISVFVAGFSRPGQHIYWISDQDRLFANGDRSEDLRRMLSRFSSYYVKHELGEVGIGTTQLDEGDRLEEDLAAIPDLAGGAVAEMLTTLSRFAGGRIPHSVGLPFSGSFSPKTEILCSWLSDNSQRLKRTVIVFERRREEGYAVFRLNMA